MIGTNCILYSIFRGPILTEFAKGNNKEEFLEFHKFLFNYHLLIPGKRILIREEAEAILNVEFSKNYSTVREQFVKYMEETNRLDITLEEWTYIPNTFEILSNARDLKNIDTNCI